MDLEVVLAGLSRDLSPGGRSICDHLCSVDARWGSERSESLVELFGRSALRRAARRIFKALEATAYRLL